MSKAKASVGEAVKVVVRCRPLNSKEKENKCNRVVEMDTTMGTVSIISPDNPTDPPKSFTFDTVFDWTSTQIQVYQGTASPVVEQVLGGYNGTVFAYGQTGTGKTHTMEGDRTNKEMRGIIPNSFEHIFDKISLDSESSYLVRVSYLEIYNEQIRDLLSDNPDQKLDLKESTEMGVYVKDLSAFLVKNPADTLTVMEAGNKNRTVGATLMNAGSSRSHSIFTITIDSSQTMPDGSTTFRVGKLNLVDLAGSERQSKTGAAGLRLKEATKINLSLSALGNVIKALVDGTSSHIPYRDSKLTRLLQDSLGGNSKTLMVANLGPADYNYEETLSTLRYADRAKQIKNKPKVNEDPKDALLRDYQEQRQLLQAELERRQAGGLINIPTSGPRSKTGPTPEQLEKIRKQKEDEMRALLSQKDLAAEERKRIEEELKISEDKARKEEAERLELESKLKEMDAILLGGQAHWIDLNQKQEAQLRRAAAELEAKALEEKRLKRELAEKQEAAATQSEKFTSLQQEADVLTKKLKKLQQKLQGAKSEIHDLQSEWQKEKEDMLENVRALSSQISLKTAIITSFIPVDEVAKTESRAQWDEEKQIWRMQINAPTNNSEISKIQRPQSASGNKRPISSYGRTAKAVGDLNPRFKVDNIISLNLDMPERTTTDYEIPAANGRSLNNSPSDEVDYTNYHYNSPNPIGNKPVRSSSNGRPSSARSVKREDDSEMYPVARGLNRR
eukprot:TRINITY_DN8067_c0_g1_i1.p1 TRINITY_DN8067_c0_g1~~TRINITY_DN8067_c0_g1_i1.p1  ORF type:complete len:730 (+),score=171.83 TRINITY_DN8067_c0_g1_i1:93-2282(+)